MKAEIKSSLTVHKGQTMIRLKFDYDVEIIAEIRKIRGRIWSKTQTCLKHGCSKGRRKENDIVNGASPKYWIRLSSKRELRSQFHCIGSGIVMQRIFSSREQIFGIYRNCLGIRVARQRKYILMSVCGSLARSGVLLKTWICKESGHQSGSPIPSPLVI